MKRDLNGVNYTEPRNKARCFPDLVYVPINVKNILLIWAKTDDILRGWWTQSLVATLRERCNSIHLLTMARRALW